MGKPLTIGKEVKKANEFLFLIQNLHFIFILNINILLQHSLK